MRRWSVVTAAMAIGLAGCGAPAPPQTSSTRPSVGTASTAPDTTAAPAAPSSTASSSTVSVPSLPEPLAAPITPTGDSSLDAALLRMARFVETARERPFLRPVDVQFLDDAAFEAVVALESDGDVEVAALRAQESLLVVLGLLPDDVDFVRLVRISQREGIVGLYMPSTGELWVRGTDATPLVSTTVVHELTHALDDQWYPDGQAAITDSDQAFAYSSLAEGSATFVEDLYRDEMSPADVVAADQEAYEYWQQMEPAGWPTSVTELSESVYTLGNAFVERLVAEGGMAALDAAYGSPPRSTEQLLHVDRYLAGDEPVRVATPMYSGTLLAEDVMGEWSLVELLNAELSPSQARAAAEGWAGDRYVLTVEGGRQCVDLIIRTDTADDADELEFALQRWAGRADGASSDRRGDVDVALTVCRTT